MNNKNFIALKDNLKGFFSIGEMKKLENAEVLLWCHDINRNYMYKGVRYSSITDSLNDRFVKMGLSTATIARPYSVISEKNCYGDVYRVNGLIARAVFLDYIIRVVIKIIRVPAETLKMYFQIIAWERILKKIKPKIIIGIEPIKELCIAANNNNIYTVDVQHGTQIDSTGQYAGHFYRMEYRGPAQKGWPDFVACWDKNATKLLKKYRGDYTKPITLGHPWIFRFLSNKDKLDSLVNEASTKYKLESNLPVILYSLQYSRDSNGNTDSLIKIPSELDSFIKKEGRCYTWWLRVHPQLLRDDFREETFNKLEELYSDYSNVNWYEVSYAPLPYILSKVALHLTRDSSVVTEASWFGIKSGLFDKPHMQKQLSSYYSNLIDKGDVEIINGYEHIKKFIHYECLKSSKNDNDEMLNNYENVLKDMVKNVNTNV